MNGVNPLGLVSNQCYQVPTEIINNLHGPNGIKQIEKNYCNESPDPVPCRLGFVRVCNSDSSTLTSTAICPAGHGEVRSKTVTSVQRMIFQVGQTEAETKCSCLQRTQVEDNLINGVNPLGLNSKQCYQVPSDMIYLNTKNGIKIYKSLSILLLFRFSYNSVHSVLISNFTSGTSAGAPLAGTPLPPFLI